MMIGPAPMIRMLSRSVRFGMSPRSVLLPFHRVDEAIEQVADVVRTGARLRMALEAERGTVLQRDALQAAVEQRLMRDAHVRGQRLLVDREAVVLARDEHVA